MINSKQIIGGVAGTILGLAGLGYYWLVRRPLPPTQGRFVLRGLQDRVEIIRDRWGVPHIHARNIHDAIFAQGFAHAQDRLWQMDFQRRLADGRLSEVLGAQTIEIDRWMRVLGLGRVGRQHAQLSDPEIQGYMQAYADGVNARIAQGRLPLEFQLLGYTPEPWRASDPLAWFKVINFGLSVNWELELLRSQLIYRLGAALAAELEPDSDHWPHCLPPEVEAERLGLSALQRADAWRRYMGPTGHQGIGSNNWVVAGWRTASGKPLLANDMHILMNTPCIWYENHLRDDQFSLTGISLAGVPGVVSGHNGRVAWGFTNGCGDVQDLYIEQLRETPAGGVEAAYRDQWTPAEVRQEVIHVKGQAQPVVERVIVTRHGPIINALTPTEAEHPLALRWTSYEMSQTARGFFRMNRAQNCAEYHAALEDFSELVLNAVYADVEGNIGYTFAGRLPIRARGDGSVPVPGWSGEYEWEGWIPFEAWPHTMNPPQGYIATANNRVVSRAYPYHLSGDYLLGDRALRIGEMIQAKTQLTLEDMQHMQYDVVSPTARAILPFWVQVTSDDAEVQAAQALLRHWDGNLQADSAPAAIYAICLRQLLRLLLQERLGALTERYLGKGPLPQMMEFSYFGQRALAWIQLILPQPDNHWFNLGGGEQRDDVLRLAWRAALDHLKVAQGPDMARWSWGADHRLMASHVFGEMPLLDRLLSHGPYPVGGDETTVNAAWSTPYGERKVSVGAPFRFVADLGNLDACRGVMLPGNSGLIGSPHYSDQVEDWLQGRYHPMLFAPADVAAGAVSHLELTPA